MAIIATPYKSGKYSRGLKVREKNPTKRDEFYKLFCRIRCESGCVRIKFPNGVWAESDFHNKDSFWRGCSELVSVEIREQMEKTLKKIGEWPWTKGRPPYSELSHVEKNEFRLHKWVKQNK